MLKYRVRCIPLLLTCALPGCGSGDGAEPDVAPATPAPELVVPKTDRIVAAPGAFPVLPPAEFVVAVSVDGLSPTVVSDLTSEGLAPTFALLQQRAAFTHRARVDARISTTLPNHTCMLTGRSTHSLLGTIADIPGHGYQVNDDPVEGETIHSGGNPNITYQPSFFDVAHDNGLSTGLFASKPKFSLFDLTWDETNGAPDTLAPDNGTDKIDISVYPVDDAAPEADVAVLTDRFLLETGASPLAVSFIHLRTPDSVGHNLGWESEEYRQAVIACDTAIGRILEFVDSHADMAGKTALIVTADHAGLGTDHYQFSYPEVSRIPFYLMSPGIEPGADLYDVLENREPGAENAPNPTQVSETQPIRNGDLANMVLSLLGLPPVPGSLMWRHSHSLAAPTPPGDLAADAGSLAVPPAVPTAAAVETPVVTDSGMLGAAGAR